MRLLTARVARALAARAMTERRCHQSPHPDSAAEPDRADSPQAFALAAALLLWPLLIIGLYVRMLLTEIGLVP